MFKRSIPVVVAVVAVLVFVSSASAVEAGTGWEAFALAHPTNLHPGGKGIIQIALLNVGARPSSGPVTVTDTLPEGLIVTAAGGVVRNGEGNTVAPEAEEIKEYGGVRWDCGGIGTGSVTCTSDPAFLPSLPHGEGKKFAPMERIAVEVDVEPGVKEGVSANRLSISGGGAMSASEVSDPLTVSAAEAVYGFSGWDVWFTNADGTVDTQAGSHPYETTFALGYNELANGKTAAGEFRNVEAELPPGFSGEPNSTPRCARVQLDAGECPAYTQIGYDMAPNDGDDIPGGPTGFFYLPVYNMVPPPGVVDEFAVTILGHNVFFDTGPRGYGEYRLVTHVDNIPASVNLSGNILTLWGVASEASHDKERLAAGKSQEALLCEEHGCSSSAPPRPFLALPTSCEGPQTFTIKGLGTWEDPGVRAEASSVSHDGQDLETGFTGCSALSFEPEISAVPDTGAADTPAGLAVNVTFPQEALRVPGGLIESTDENTTVTLPAGLVINPGQAAGLAACSQAQARLDEEGAPSCPSASKVGTVKIQTPLLEGAFEPELNGSVYVLAQSQGGEGEPPNLQSHPPTLQLLIAASGDGVNLKLVGDTQLNEATGQLTTTLTKTPGLPFTHFELVFSGGAQAALATPTGCGSYTTTSDFTPWASPFASDQFPSSTFQITGGPDAGGCPSSPLPFSPSLIAGATNPKGGGFTSFSLLLQNGDGQQRIEKLQFKAPEGLSGMLSTVALCPEPQAQEGKCTESSRIGHAAVASGPGAYPLVIPQPGNPESQIYLTGPYEGAPFGLSIVTHVIAGPFNLGTIVTRAKIEVDPLTAQIAVTTDPLPQIIDGVPTDLRLVDSVIEREGFMFNPTHCAPSSFSGTAWGTPPPGAGGPGTSAAISSPFDVVGCKGLTFAPKFTASTTGAGSKADGASLTTKVLYPTGSLGSESDIRSVKVDLPVQLPSRLGTLQQACRAHQFSVNPAGCPAASVVGHAVVHTPVLPVPLEGPAYFVSNGGESFPDLIMVLQGDGVTVQLVGETFISKSSITSSTFKTVPDQPFSSFELTLPEGPDSALAPYLPVKDKYSFCGQKLVMPTDLVGQNGAEIRQNTPITVTGCKTTMSNTQRLAAALKACHKDKGNAKRTACEARAHRKYATPKKKRKQ
jgi:hypothetical protein